MAGSASSAAADAKDARLYTQCPECGTVFRVTAAVLRAAQAQVRCGVCDANFNALRFLTDELEAGVTPSSGDTVASGTPGPGRDAAADHDAIADSAAAPPQPAPGSPVEAAPGPQSDSARADRPDAVAVCVFEAEPATTIAPETADGPEPETASDLAREDDPQQPGSDSEPPAEPEPAPLAEPGDGAPPETEPTSVAHADAAPEPAAAAETEGDPVETAAADAAAVEDAAGAAPGDAPEAHPEPPPATRTTPSADEARAFDEMTASLQATHAAADVPTGEYNVLQPEDVGELLLDGPGPDGSADEADRALEFNVPPADWERIFVESNPATPLSALDLSLGPTAEDPGDPGHETLLLDPEPETADDAIAVRPVLDELPSSEPDLVLHWIDGDDATGEPPVLEPATDAAPEPAADAGAAPPEDEFDVELDLGAALDAARVSRRGAADLDDPLARTDEYPLPDFSDVPATLDGESATDHDLDVDFGLGPATEAPSPPEDEPPAQARLEDAVPQAEHAGLGGDEPAPLVIAADEFRPRAVRPSRERPSPGTIGVAGLLALALAGQLVHHARESLVDTPIIGPPLAALYRGAGAPVEPRWNLAAYEVRQWGASSDSTPGALRLRASIVNRADRAQPYPLLRVVLEDRFGGAIARREFRPSEYLPGHAVPATPLAAGARADADLRLVDPGSEVVGFELDVCLERRGVLVCGSDPRPPGS